MKFRIVQLLLALELSATCACTNASQPSEDPLSGDLRTITLSILNYRHRQGHFPSAVDRHGEDGQPCSWRITLLRELDENALYESYRFNETWDSDTNRRLLAEMPLVFEYPDRGTAVARYLANDNYSTHLVAVVGEDTLWRNDGRKFMPPKDGAENTIVVMYLPTSRIPWTEPKDLTIDEAVDLLATPDSVGTINYSDHILYVKAIKIPFFRVGFADGHIGGIAAGLRPELARALFTSDGGEIVDLKARESYQSVWNGKPIHPAIYYFKWDRIAGAFLVLVAAMTYMRTRIRRSARSAEARALVGLESLSKG